MNVSKKADPRNVNVNFLPSTVSQKDLRDHFDRCGLITSAKVVYSQYTGEHMGYGFVTFATEASAQRAITEMHNTELHGKRIKVCQARGPSHSILSATAISTDLHPLPVPMQSVTAIGNTRVDPAPIPVMPSISLPSMPVPQQPQAPMPIASLPMAPMQQVPLHTMPQQLAGSIIQSVAPAGEPQPITLIRSASQFPSPGVVSIGPPNPTQILPMHVGWAQGAQPPILLQPMFQLGAGAFSATNDVTFMPTGVTLAYR